MMIPLHRNARWRLAGDERADPRRSAHD